MSKIDPSFIDDIFGIPRDGSNIQDDDSDAYSGLDDQATKMPFEEKAAEVSKEIQAVISGAPQAAEKQAEKAPTKKESVSVTPKKDDVETAAKSVVPADPTSTTSMFGDIFVAPTETKKEEPKVAPKVETKVEVKPEPTPTPKVETKVENETKATPQVATDGEGQQAKQPSRQSSEPLKVAGSQRSRWTLVSPGPKYDYFYAQKRDSLENDLLVGGELDFDKSFRELEEAHVDVNVGETFQPELVAKQMQQVQQWRDRVKLVQLRTNRQYFIWARVMDLFGGLLARIEDVRGVEKREGIKYEHMYDMHAYFGSLESLHKSVTAVMANLDGAFECLSRQVTITMPIKDVERYTTSPKPYSPALQGYDGLKKQANGGGSQAVNRPNEAEKSAEPKPTKSGWDI